MGPGVEIQLLVRVLDSRLREDTANKDKIRNMSSHRINKQWRLKNQPSGMVVESDFECVEEPIPDVSDGEFLVRNLYIAMMPATRLALKERRLNVGDIIRSTNVAQVVESKHPHFNEGALITGGFGWQEYDVSNGGPTNLGPIRPVPEGVQPSLVLGPLGATAVTGYFGILDVGELKEGDVVVISGAAGATGSVAGPVARIKGAGKVVGIAGGEEKCRLLTEVLGYDSAIDYKSEDVEARLKEECPEGINLFFDNVGGDILEAALLNMAHYGRIVLCGNISAYNATELPPGPKNYMELVTRRCTMRGFMTMDYAKQMPAAREELAAWLESGELKYLEDIQEGIENAPKTFLRLFEGKNHGKQLLKLGDPDT